MRARGGGSRDEFEGEARGSRNERTMEETGRGAAGGKECVRELGMTMSWSECAACEVVMVVVAVVVRVVVGLEDTGTTVIGRVTG